MKYKSFIGDREEKITSYIYVQRYNWKGSCDLSSLSIDYDFFNQLIKIQCDVYLSSFMSH